MMNRLLKNLSTIGLSLEKNTLNPEFSDFVLRYEDKVVGYGWNSKNIKQKVGFMGWAAPAWENCIWKPTKFPKNLIFEEVINLFQFAISEDLMWFSLPTNNTMVGHCSQPYSDTKEFISSLKQFIDNDFDPKIFLNKD